MFKLIGLGILGYSSYRAYSKNRRKVKKIIRNNPVLSNIEKGVNSLYKKGINLLLKSEIIKNK